MNCCDLIHFVKPYYETKDTMHDLSHIHRVLEKLHQLMLAGSYDADLDILTYAAYFHGMIYNHETDITNYLIKEKISPEKISKIKAVAWASQKDQVPTSLEGKLLHDAHMIEGSKRFLAVKSLVTGSVRGQTLQETLAYINDPVLNTETCYLPEAITQYASQKQYAKALIHDLSSTAATIQIRHMTLNDALELVLAFERQGWNKPLALFQTYLDEQTKNERFVFVALYEGQLAGYITLLHEAKNGPFAHLKTPEIVDFNVLISFQNKGVGSALLSKVEQVANQYHSSISLAVGLHSGYGAAQRLYIKRGYLFDGSGVWYQNQPLLPYTTTVNDDDLVLYLSKQLDNKMINLLR